MRLERGGVALVTDRAFVQFSWQTRWFTFYVNADAHQHGWNVYHFVSWHPLTRQQNRKDRDAS